MSRDSSSLPIRKPSIYAACASAPGKGEKPGTLAIVVSVYLPGSEPEDKDKGIAQNQQRAVRDGYVQRCEQQIRPGNESGKDADKPADGVRTGHKSNDNDHGEDQLHDEGRDVVSLDGLVDALDAVKVFIAFFVAGKAAFGLLVVDAEAAGLIYAFPEMRFSWFGFRGGGCNGVDWLFADLANLDGLFDAFKHQVSAVNQGCNHADDCDKFGS